MSRLVKPILKLVHFAYPGNRPSLVPFPIRVKAAKAGITGLVWCYRLGWWLGWGIGGVAPDIAAKRRNGIKKGVAR